uniref:GtrA family protein n=1 Tax=Streptomyces sp. NBC_01401 TaxID=2903854 RepID=A0AAU3GQY4_9ACTN
MNPVEYAPARRHRLRKVLYDVALGVVANLVVAALTAAASLLF